VVTSMFDRRIAAGAGLSLGAFLGMTAAAGAADYTVDRMDDPAGTGGCVLATPNDCSLRQALINAENGNSPIVDRVLFKSGLSGTIALTSAGLSVTDPVDIVGPGANVLAVSGGDFQRVLDTDQFSAGDPVTISGLTLTRGYGSGVVGGGAIYSNDTSLTIDASTISDSSAGPGDYPGGGIRQIGGGLLIRNSTISGNDGGNGGGVYAFGADLGVQNSTISGNTATGTGGGSGIGYGGGIWFDGGASHGTGISGSTISGNHAYDGGGITAASTNKNLASTVVANNTATAATPHLDLRNADPSPFQLAFSLVESTTGANIADNPSFAGSNVFGVDPQLGPLAANGGPTRTLKPALTSPLVDKAVTASGITDQRGLARPFDVPSIGNSSVGPADGADIGAVELQASDFTTTPPPTQGGAPQTQAPPTQAPVRKCKKKKHKRSAESAKKKCKKKKKRFSAASA
jgi:hypothetical protein